MKIDAIKAMLETSNGEHIYEIFIPSIKRNIPFKLLNMGQIKSISKLAMDESTIDFKLSQLGVIKTVCLEKDLDISKLTDVDFVSVITGLRINNVLEELKLSITCGSCQTKFNYTANLNNIMQKCLGYKQDDYTFEKTVDEKKFKIIYGDPYYINYLNFENIIEDINKNDEISNDEKVKTSFTIYPLQFIKEIYINNVDIGFNELEINEKMEIIDILPPYVLIGEDGLIKSITSVIEENKTENFYDKISCPKCKNKIQGGLDDFENFFIL
jgi:hypothetical protein